MKVDLSKEIKDYSGEIVKNQDENDAMTIASVLLTSLNMPLKEDADDTGDKRMIKFNLIQNIHKNQKGHIVLKSEQMVILKDRVLKVFPSPVIYGRICEAFGENDSK